MTSGLSFSATTSLARCQANSKRPWLNLAVWFGMDYLVPTDLWQPVDAGYAQILKVLIGQAQRKRLDDEERSGTATNHPSQPRKGGF